MQILTLAVTGQYIFLITALFFQRFLGSFFVICFSTIVRFDCSSIALLFEIESFKMSNTHVGLYYEKPLMFEIYPLLAFKIGLV